MSGHINQRLSTTVRTNSFNPLNILNPSIGGGILDLVLSWAKQRQLKKYSYFDVKWFNSTETWSKIRPKIY